jgi:hypothetical protein
LIFVGTSAVRAFAGNPEVDRARSVVRTRRILPSSGPNVNRSATSTIALIYREVYTEKDTTTSNSSRVHARFGRRETFRFICAPFHRWDVPAFTCSVPSSPPKFEERKVFSSPRLRPIAVPAKVSCPQPSIVPPLLQSVSDLIGETFSSRLSWPLFPNCFSMKTHHQKL